MNSKTDALVLHTIKYGDSRFIVDMFTREHGRLSFLVSGASRSSHPTARSQAKKPYFQPLTLLSVEAVVRPQQQLHRLRSTELLCPWQTLLDQPAKLAIALFVAEFLYYALRAEQKDYRLFDYVRASLEWLDGCRARYANFHLVFLIHLSRFLGFFPNVGATPSSCAPSPYFDLRAATFCTTPPPHHDYILPEEASHLSPLMRMDYATMHLFRLSREQRSRIIDIIVRYYRLHLPAFPELHSLSVLRELYD